MWSLLGSYLSFNFAGELFFKCAIFVKVGILKIDESLVNILSLNVLDTRSEFLVGLLHFLLSLFEIFLGGIFLRLGFFCFLGNALMIFLKLFLLGFYLFDLLSDLGSIIALELLPSGLQGRLAQVKL